MDTSALKSFAPWARTALINEVTGRIAAVLGQSSPERIEQRAAVTELEKKIKAAGGGDTGRAAVAEQVAYTWFNRIIALRFMDANRYTGIGVVSPQAGIEVGQPEILADAKAGNFDSHVVTPQIRDTVSALLDGTRRSADPQGEAYALLLTDYCRHWHRAMPFMFEHEGDFTELLIPANLLADESVLNRAVKVMTKEACKDVEVIGWLYQFYISERKDEVFAGFKKGKKAGAAEIPAATQLFTPDWIVRYLVQNSLGRLWMLNRPNSRLVDQMDYYIAPVDEETDFLKINSPEELTVMDPACGSGHMLTYAFDLLYSIYEEEGYAPSEIPGLILTKNLFGVEIDPRAGALAAFALTMKARERQRTFFGKTIVPNICVLESIQFTPQELDFLLTSDGDPDEQIGYWNQFKHADTLGSLIQPDAELTARLRDHIAGLNDGDDIINAEHVERAKRVIVQATYLLRQYRVAIANPPYMGGKSASALLQERLKKQFPVAKADLYSAFIQRCRTLVESRGIVAMVTMQSWMFLSTFEKLRHLIIESDNITMMAHLGSNAFDTIGGEVVSTTAFILSVGNATESRPGTYLRLIGGTSEAAKARNLRDAAQGNSDTLTFRVDARHFEVLSGAQIAYWLPDAALDAYRKFDTLGQHSYGQPGLQTSDNARFTRLWHEVSQDQFYSTATDSEMAQKSGRRWFPLVKGGDYRKWYGNLEYVVNWKHNGFEIKSSISDKYPYLNGNVDYVVKDRGYFFRESITYNRITAGRFVARYTEPGTIFDVAGSAVFPNSNKWGVLGFLCSSTAEYLMRAQNPTFTVQSGDVAALPYPAQEIEELGTALTDPVKQAVEWSRNDWDSMETAWNFRVNPLVKLDYLRIEDRVSELLAKHMSAREGMAAAESKVNFMIAQLFGVAREVDCSTAASEVTLRSLNTASAIQDLLSYAVGCMFGRYSLDEPGLILADQGATLQDYLAKVPKPTFRPDTDNVLPIIDGDWFEDDIVARFRQFLRAAFGQEHFEENLRLSLSPWGSRTFVTTS